MKKLKRFTSFVLSAFLICLCLVSCADGGSGGNEGKTTEPNSEEETKQAVSPVIADGIMIVGTGMSAAPFTFGDENGYPAGFDIAMINLIGSRLGVDAVIEPADKDDPISSLGSFIEVVISALPIDESNDKVDFSKAYHTSKQVALVASGIDDITSAKSLGGKNVGARPGYGPLLAAQEVDAKVKEYGDSKAAAKDLIDGKLDAVIVDKSIANALLKEHGSKLKAADGVKLEDVGYGIALPKGDKALAAAVNDAIDKIISDEQGGAYKNINKQFLEISR